MATVRHEPLHALHSVQEACAAALMPDLTMTQHLCTLMLYGEGTVDATVHCRTPLRAHAPPPAVLSIISVSRCTALPCRPAAFVASITSSPAPFTPCAATALAPAHLATPLLALQMQVTAGRCPILILAIRRLPTAKLTPMQDAVICGVNGLTSVPPVQSGWSSMHEMFRAFSKSPV